jgi:Xaa-Pro aminopeptidase
LNGFAPSEAEIIAKTGVDSVIQTKSIPSPEGIVYTASPSPVQSPPPGHEFTALLAASAIARRVKRAPEIACLRAAAIATSNSILEAMNTNLKQFFDTTAAAMAFATSHSVRLSPVLGIPHFFITARIVHV